MKSAPHAPTASDAAQSSARVQDVLGSILSSLLEPLGYELVAVEIQNQRQKILRLFIDRLGNNSEQSGVGIEDCVTVTRALDEPLENHPEIEAIFKGPYELEVSSPGVDRPLRTERDFTRFRGRQVRVHTYRPLTREEAANDDYFARNPKQKNFLGSLEGLAVGTAEPSIVLRIARELSKKEQREQKRAAKEAEKRAKLEGAPTTPVAATGDAVTLPIQLISKACLEPNFDFRD